MLITRFLFITALFPAMSTAAAACEHCRAAAAAAAARAQAETSPADLAVVAIRTAGQELRQSEAARKHLCEESKKLMTARAGMLRELQMLDAQLLALKTHVHRREYPLELGQQVVSDEDTAHKVGGQLLLRQETLTAAVSRISGELEAGEQERLMLEKQIHQRQTEILLAQHRAARLRAVGVPDKAAQPLQTLRTIAPPGSAESLRRQLLDQFLREGLGSRK
jgi:hypothetical protein